MSRSEEIWKDIPEFEGLYQVSNLGRVKSLERKAWNGRCYRTMPEKILHCVKNKEGRLQVSLCKYCIVKVFLVHRLIADAFIPNLENKPEVHHINGIRTDNRADNLLWVTRKEHEKLHPDNLKNAIEKNKKPVIAIKLKTGVETYYESQNEAAKQLNICAANLNKVLQGKLNHTGGYTFKYAS